MKTSTLIAALFLSLSAIGCSNPDAATCAPSGPDSIVCTSTVAACIADGAGACETGGPGDLVLNSDGTFRQEFGAYAQTGTYTIANGIIVLISGGQIVGTVSVSETK